MADRKGFQEHWLDIDPERMERYESMFQWNPATEHYYDAARLGPGLAVADFGCGPGHAAIEFANRTAPNGHVHALDINKDFVARAHARAEATGLADRITVHLMTEARLPLADASLDRVVARNTIIYVEDPLFTLAEFRRVLRPGGIAHMIESDWRLTAVEPVPTAEWRAVIEAASWAWPRPEIGRELYGIARRAGFGEVAVQMLTSPDTTGRLAGMIRTVAGYGRSSGTIAESRVDDVLDTVDKAIAAGTYLAISPQFIVTATA